ncbi:hypothetical protein ACMD2_23290, partial [Ananas comosus]
FSTASPWRRRRPRARALLPLHRRSGPRPPQQRRRRRRRRGGGASPRAAAHLEAVLEQCQRTLEMLKNADLEPDPDAGDEIGSKGSAGEEEEEEERRGGAIAYPSSVDYETDEIEFSAYGEHATAENIADWTRCNLLGVKLFEQSEWFQTHLALVICINNLVALQVQHLNCRALRLDLI